MINNSLLAAFLVLMLWLLGCNASVEQSYTHKVQFQFRYDDTGQAVYVGRPELANSSPNLVLTLITSRMFLPGELEFRKTRIGDQIPLDSVIIMPEFNKPASLKIEFLRTDVSEKFIQDMFFDKNTDVIENHSFSSPGFETILTEKRLILTMYSGTALHLRNDMKGIGGRSYKTFTRPNVMGRVTKISGIVAHSTDRILIRIKLRDFYADAAAAVGGVKLQKGGLQLQPKNDSIPYTLRPRTVQTTRRYSPRILEGP